ncbi:hypothetical protein [Bufonid herpesvirus 1]|uniref:hypothetical protein n=1 Tax=Bufonid herpesvirus 1 TaxID=2282206 RepID=UPI000EB699B9|nr:hypothetical protein [Bufonid herpesvirus 1]AXF48519.1 hypothetical protein [Bufonid herpesvirus 1]
MRPCGFLSVPVINVRLRALGHRRSNHCCQAQCSDSQKLCLGYGNQVQHNPKNQKSRSLLQKLLIHRTIARISQDLTEGAPKSNLQREDAYLPGSKQTNHQETAEISKQQNTKEPPPLLRHVETQTDKLQKHLKTKQDPLYYTSLSLETSFNLVGLMVWAFFVLFLLMVVFR